MLQKDLGYNPLKDVSQVDQFGFVDISYVLTTGNVPGDLSVKDDEYNGIDDPRSIVGKPSDVFDALSMSASLEMSQSPEPSGDGA